jgi:hypothetical protein
MTQRQRMFATLRGEPTDLILGISDSTPPQADLDRLIAIRKAIERLGPIAPGSRLYFG